MIPLALLSLFLYAASAAPFPRSSLPFRQMVIFGDRLSAEMEDVRGSQAWPKLVSDQLQLDLIDYSQFGPTTDNQIDDMDDESVLTTSLSTLDQIDEYISLNRHGDLPSSSLFVISTSLNEFYSDDTITAGEVAMQVEQGIRKLVEIGGKSFLVVAPPPPADPEEEQSTDLSSETAADYFAYYLRRNLRFITNRINRSLRSQQVSAVFIDLYTLYSNIMANPSAYGFPSGRLLSVPCNNEGLVMQSSGRCEMAHLRLYYSENQPTNAGHEHIAIEVQRKIQSEFMPAVRLL